MRKPFVIQLALLLLAAAIFVLGASFDADATKKCLTIGQKSVCFDDGKSKKGNDDADPVTDDFGEAEPATEDLGENDANGAAGGEDDQPKAATKPFTCAKAQCDAGEVKLDKPNAYGACCQPMDRCPPERPSGTPPNCCPKDTTFREGFCRVSECPPGTTGVPPHCDRVCAPGKVKVEQSCYDPCPPGTLGTPPDKCRCPDDHDWDAASATCKERPKCTGGMVGTPPNCQCPAKTVLQDGTCQKCTKGRVAKDGQCQCPSGQVFVKADDKCQPCEGDQEVIKGFCQCRSGTIEFPSNSARCVKSLGLTCQWRGEAPFCDGECERGEVQYDRGTERSHVLHQENRHTFGKPCATGLKVYCCRPQ
jgi:hypothetical protein